MGSVMLYLLQCRKRHTLEMVAAYLRPNTSAWHSNVAVMFSGSSLFLTGSAVEKQSHKTSLTPHDKAKNWVYRVDVFMHNIIHTNIVAKHTSIQNESVTSTVTCIVGCLFWSISLTKKVRKESLT